VQVLQIERAALSRTTRFWPRLSSWSKKTEVSCPLQAASSQLIILPTQPSVGITSVLFGGRRRFLNRCDTQFAKSLSISTLGCRDDYGWDEALIVGSLVVGDKVGRRADGIAPRAKYTTKAARITAKQMKMTRCGSSGREGLAGLVIVTPVSRKMGGSAVVVSDGVAMTRTGQLTPFSNLSSFTPPYADGVPIGTSGSSHSRR